MLRGSSLESVEYDAEVKSARLLFRVPEDASVCVELTGVVHLSLSVLAAAGADSEVIRAGVQNVSEGAADLLRSLGYLFQSLGQGVEKSLRTSLVYFSIEGDTSIHIVAHGYTVLRTPGDRRTRGAARREFV